MWKYFKTFRGNLTTLIIAAILVPMLVSGMIFGVMLDNQLRAIFENRLKAGLKTFSMVLNYRQQDLARGLERIASDNTLQMTLELDIISQMRKYLSSQVAVLKFAGVCVADSEKNIIAAAGQPGFSYSLPNMKDSTVNLIASGGELFYGYSVPIVKGEKLLGYVRGTVSLTDREFQASLHEKLVNSFIMWVNGRPAVSDIAPETMKKMDLVPRPDLVTDIQIGSHQYRTMVKTTDIGGKKLAYAVLLPLNQLKQNFKLTMLTVVVVIVIIFGVIMFFGHIFIRKLIKPVTELTAAASAIEIGSMNIPALETERDDEFGFLNRTFVEMLDSTDRYITELKQMEEELRTYQEKLEQMVEERTAELKKTQKELVNKAMEAGRAQLSAMILHNIGNAVTPVIAYLDSLKNDDIDEIYRYMVKCYGELNAKGSEFSRYLGEDSRDREVFSYMGELINTLAVSHKKQSDQVDKIESAVSYISEILSLQQSYATAEHEMKAKHDLNTLVEDAIRMQAGAFEKRNIRVRYELDPNLPHLLIDKNRFMQVLVNLIKNGYEAIDEVKADRQNTMTFRTFSRNGNTGLEISDSGIGIDPAFMPQVFKFGKSSKGSTGFGLHYCKIFVEANNGTLNISSPGRGKGASITVEFENQKL